MDLRLAVSVKHSHQAEKGFDQIQSIGQFVETCHPFWLFRGFSLRLRIRSCAKVKTS